MGTVYKFNVKGFCGGKRGAVNGMRPSGDVDTTSMQSSEVQHSETVLALYAPHRDPCCLSHLIMGGMDRNNICGRRRDATARDGGGSVYHRQGYLQHSL